MSTSAPVTVARFREPDFGLHGVFLELVEFVGHAAARGTGQREFAGAVIHGYIRAMPG